MAGTRNVSSPTPIGAPAPPGFESPGGPSRYNMNETPSSMDRDQADTGNVEKMAEQIVKLLERIESLEAKLANKIDTADSKESDTKPGKPKPLDIKDVKKPDEYNGDTKNFKIWFERLKDLMINRSEAWEDIIKGIEAYKDKRVPDGAPEMFVKLSLFEHADVYLGQLKSYLRTYTTGNLYERVNNTDKAKIPELFRETIHKGRNRNKNNLVTLKTQALSPPVANKASDLDKILTDWDNTINQIMQQDVDYTLDDDTRKTILLKICPRDFVKELRDKYNADPNKDYHDLKQDLDEEIATRKMDEKVKSGANLSEVRHGERDDAERAGGAEPEYVETEVWVEELQSWVCGLAPKRPAPTDNDGDGDGEAKRPRPDDKGTKGRGKGKGGKGPCWSCGGPHLQRDCPEQGKTVPTTTAWSSWRPGAFPGPSPQQWRSWIPKKGKGKGKGGKGKGKRAKAKVWDLVPSSEQSSKSGRAMNGLTLTGECQASA